MGPVSPEPGVDVDAVLSLLRAAAAADGVRPVSEETELRLQHRTGSGSDLAVRDAGELAGYARYDDGVAELVVHPQTVRYRMTQLRELYGDALADPDAVLELTVALALPARP